MLGVLFVQRVCFCGRGMTLTADRNKEVVRGEGIFDAKGGFAGKRWGF